MKPLLGRQMCKRDDRRAIEKEIEDYKSVVRKQLYIGMLSGTAVVVQALQGGTKCSTFWLQYMKPLDNTPRAFRNCSCILKYPSCSVPPFKHVVMPEPPMLTKSENPNVWEEFIEPGHSFTTAHSIGWTSKLAREVARSTRAAELLSATHAVYKLTCFEKLLEKIV